MLAILSLFAKKEEVLQQKKRLLKIYRIYRIIQRFLDNKGNAGADKAVFKLIAYKYRVKV